MAKRKYIGKIKSEKKNNGGNFPEKMNEWRAGRKIYRPGGDKKEEALKTRSFLKDCSILICRMDTQFTSLKKQMLFRIMNVWMWGAAMKRFI